MLEKDDALVLQRRDSPKDDKAHKTLAMSNFVFYLITFDDITFVKYSRYNVLFQIKCIYSMKKWFDISSPSQLSSSEGLRKRLFSDPREEDR